MELVSIKISLNSSRRRNRMQRVARW